MDKTIFSNKVQEYITNKMSICIEDLTNKILEDVPHSSLFFNDLFEYMIDLKTPYTYDYNDQDFGIPKNHLYDIAKKIAFTDKDFSEYILDFLDEKHIFGYEAFIHAHNNDEKKIDNIINNIELDYEIYEEVERYVECILEVGLSIVDVFPLKALEILNSINEAYPILGHLPHETIDLSVDIVCNIAKQDIAKSLEYLDIVEVEHYKLEALEKIRQYPQSKEMADRLDEMIVNLKNVLVKMHTIN